MSSPYSSQNPLAFRSYDHPDQFEWTQEDGSQVYQGGVIPGITRADAVEIDLFPPVAAHRIHRAAGEFGCLSISGSLVTL